MAGPTEHRALQADLYAVKEKYKDRQKSEREIKREREGSEEANVEAGKGQFRQQTSEKAMRFLGFPLRPSCRA